MQHQAIWLPNFAQLSCGYPEGPAANDVIDLFNKKFKFTWESTWNFPELKYWFSTPSWKVKELENLKCRLNIHKSQLNDFDIEQWSSHTRRRNPAGEVCWKVRCLINPEFLTQAWTKFYECAHTYSIIPKESVGSRKIVSLHLCEAPGAFITSLNHYLKQHYKELDWKWVATTLNPYYEGNSLSNMITDDRFIFHTLDNWNFGSDSTGNLMDWQNSQETIAKAKSLGKVMLVTADGSIDCLLKPEEQEQTTSPLHYCEIVTALQVLSPGGTFVFKLFTIFEHYTVCLLYLINLLFREVNIFKPVTSRQGNSEVYAICLHYKGSDELQQYIPILQTAYGTESYGNTALFPLEVLPNSFLYQIKECANYFSSMQCDVIDSNIYAYLVPKNYSMNNNLKKLRAMVSTEFIKRYNLCPLNFEDEILKGSLHEENKVNNNPRYHRGSYTDHQRYLKMSFGEKIDSMHSSLNDCIQTNPTIFINSTYHKPVKWLDIYNEKCDFDSLICYRFGRPLQAVKSSKFIFVPILRLYQQMLSENKFKEIVLATLNGQIRNPIRQVENNITKITFPEYDFTENYSVYEKRCFKSLCACIKEMHTGQNLLLIRFNTLTHFAVSVIYMLGIKFFKKTGFTNQSIIMENFVNENVCYYLNQIECQCNKAAKEATLDLLNFLKVQLTNNGNFYDNVVKFNNTVYKNKCIDNIRAIQNNL